MSAHEFTYAEWAALMGRGEPVKPASCEKALCSSGVFKGAEGLRQFSECQEFWDDQPYGTRFYFGDGNYLHRGVLRAAVRLLDSAQAPAVDGAVLKLASKVIDMWDCHWPSILAEGFHEMSDAIEDLRDHVKAIKGEG